MIFRAYPEDLHIIQLDNGSSYYSQAQSPETYNPSISTRSLLG